MVESKTNRRTSSKCAASPEPLTSSSNWPRGTRSSTFSTSRQCESRLTPLQPPDPASATGSSPIASGPAATVIVPRAHRPGSSGTLTSPQPSSRFVRRDDEFNCDLSRMDLAIARRWEVHCSLLTIRRKAVLSFVPRLLEYEQLASQPRQDSRRPDGRFHWLRTLGMVEHNERTTAESMAHTSSGRIGQ